MSLYSIKFMSFNANKIEKHDFNLQEEEQEDDDGVKLLVNDRR